MPKTMNSGSAVPSIPVSPIYRIHCSSAGSTRIRSAPAHQMNKLWQPGVSVNTLSENLVPLQQSRSFIYTTRWYRGAMSATNCMSNPPQLGFQSSVNPTIPQLSSRNRHFLRNYTKGGFPFADRLQRWAYGHCLNSTSTILAKKSCSPYKTSLIWHFGV